MFFFSKNVKKTPQLKYILEKKLFKFSKMTFFTYKKIVNFANFRDQKTILNSV